MRRRESSIQLAVVSYARNRGCLAWKLSAENNSGVPDYMLLFSGAVWFAEFKCEDGNPSRLQRYVIADLRKRGYTVELINNVENGRRYVDQQIGKLLA
jgi:hypothetical protein